MSSCSWPTVRASPCIYWSHLAVLTSCRMQFTRVLLLGLSSIVCWWVLRTVCFMRSWVGSFEKPPSKKSLQLYSCAGKVPDFITCISISEESAWTLASDGSKNSHISFLASVLFLNVLIWHRHFCGIGYITHIYGYSSHIWIQYSDFSWCNQSLKRHLSQQSGFSLWSLEINRRRWWKLK